MTNNDMVSRAVWSVCWVLAACGCGTVQDTELFSQSNAQLIEHQGEECELDAVGENETVVDEDHPECAPGYCVGSGGQPWTHDDLGICTCRCDGPEGTGPLCDCAQGFECKELIEDLGLGKAHIAGSYCVPQP